MKKILFIISLLSSLGCTQTNPPKERESILPGAYQVNEYLTLLQNKNVGLVINHTSVIQNQLILDTLLSLGITIKKVFTPEHGLKGTASNGELVEYNSQKSDYELISLYGKNKKPSIKQLSDLDIVVFDLQDVGARFYTYISTMQYMMEACASFKIPFIVLDRPNPNASYIDGPVLDTAFSSNVGLIPIPIVYGMTNGELAQMINGENWLGHNLHCNLKVIKVKNWNHDSNYSLPIKPSPNLPNDLSIALYPSLCLFEGTIISVGRGTQFPFQQIGHPHWPIKQHSFIPMANEGAKWPPFENQTCYGISWMDSIPKYRFSIEPIIIAYNMMDSTHFFNGFFKRLAGSEKLEKQIRSGMNEEEIRKSWQKDLNNFKAKRERYLLYD